jgi:acyl-CoA synthetase (NDP forming)
LSHLAERTRDLHALFDPVSVALVGASRTPTKWGHLIARSLLAGEHRRTVYLVSRGGGEILGREAYPSLADLPAAPELVVVTVPAAAVEETVDQALAAGAKGLVVFAVGYGEESEAGRVREEALAERVRAAGAFLVGPNCNGVYDAEAELEAMAWIEAGPGHIGMLSQSGQVIIECTSLARSLGLGFSRLVSFGNQVDVDAAELVRAMIDHEPTKVIAAYVEGFRDGRAFVRAAAEAAAAGKPVVLVSPPPSDASARAAHTHTGSLLSDGASVDAACRAAGIVRVSTPRELLDVGRALAVPQRPRGRRVGIVADGGGQAVVGTAVAIDAGLEVPQLGEALVRTIEYTVAGIVTTSNPVDVAGGAVFDLESYGRVVRLLLESGEVDSVLLTGYFGGYEGQALEFAAPEAEVAAGMARAVADTGKPLVVHAWHDRGGAGRTLKEAGVPVYREIEGAVGALARLVELAESRPTAPPDCPRRDGPVELADYWRARELVAAAGLRLAAARPARSVEEAAGAAAEVGYPAVLKALGSSHKSEGGGVVVGLADEAALRAAYEGLPSGEVSVEAMAPVAAGVELIVGVRRDPAFGPILLVGLGGIYAEVLRDVATALAPVDPEEAERLLLSLRGAALLRGARGRPPLDLAAAAAAAAALSRFAAGDAAVAELEVNPLLVTPDGALALDARALLVT